MDADVSNSMYCIEFEDTCLAIHLIKCTHICICVAGHNGGNVTRQDNEVKTVAQGELLNACFQALRQILTGCSEGKWSISRPQDWSTIGK